jgi:hypothetical protein
MKLAARAGALTAAAGMASFTYQQIAEACDRRRFPPPERAAALGGRLGSDEPDTARFAVRVPPENRLDAADLLFPEGVVHRLPDDFVERAVLVDHEDFLALATLLRGQERCVHIDLETAQAAVGLGLWRTGPYDWLAKYDSYLLRLIGRARLIAHDRLAPCSVH